MPGGMNLPISPCCIARASSTAFFTASRINLSRNSTSSGSTISFAILSAPSSESGWYSSLEDEGGWEMFGYTLGMSVLARGSSKFGRAADGSLLVRQSEVGSLMVLQWPVFPMANARWIRFPAAASELQAGSDRQAGIPP